MVTGEIVRHGRKIARAKQMKNERPVESNST